MSTSLGKIDATTIARVIQALYKQKKLNPSYNVHDQLADAQLDNLALYHQIEDLEEALERIRNIITMKEEGVLIRRLLLKNIT